MNNVIKYIVFCSVAAILILAGVLIIIYSKRFMSKVPDTLRSEESRTIDMIMWYDIDNGPATNYRGPYFVRPEKGWNRLNPQHPNAVTTPGVYRVTTPLLGLYDQSDPEVARQHLYWIMATGCNVITVDWTNYTADYGAIYVKQYSKGVYKNTKVLFETAKDTKDFTPPKIYITVRLNGSNTEELKGPVEDAYTLYTEYKEQWYTLDDRTVNAQKPLLVIFADGNVLSEIANGNIPFQDDRFNIRWSNGLLPSYKEEEDGTRSIPGDNPTWMFLETELDSKAGDGYYKVYHKDNSFGGVEQMHCWASVVDLGRTGSKWDAMNNIVDGKTPLERTLRMVKELKPQTLLVCRFNYPVAWYEIPYEGISLYESTHIEPNEDFGFDILNSVMKNLYELNRWKREAPDKSLPVSQKDGSIIIPLESFPLEYRISLSNTMEGSEWSYLDINQWIVIPEEWSGNTVYIQTKNAFGESVIVSFVSQS